MIQKSIGSTKTEEDEMQKIAANVGIITSMVGFLPGILISLIFGSVGDKYGRKPLLLYGIASTCLFLYAYAVEFGLFP
jgi:MFS family permease